MLVKLMPDQVTNYWDILSYGIQQSLPPITYDSPKRLTRILESIMMEEMECWIGTKDKTITGIIVTCEIYEKNSDVRDLLIYCLYGFDRLSPKLIKEGMHTLKEYAASKGLKRITAYSNVPSVIRLMKTFGSGEAWQYLTIPANGAVQ